MIELILAGAAGLALSAACGFARRWQGVAKKTWPLKRSWRMLVLWPPIAIAFIGVALLAGVPWWIGLLAGAWPGVWSWMPGKLNSFAVWEYLLRFRTRYIFAEGLQGGIGGLMATAAILGVAVL